MSENNKNLEQQRAEFLKKLEIQEKMLDQQLGNTKSNKETKTDNTVNLPLPKKELSPEEELEQKRKMFLADLDRKDAELDKTIAYENSLEGSNLSRRKKQSSKELMKFHFYKTLIGAVLIIVALVIICKFVVGNSFEEIQSTATEHNINQVKIALINYYNEYNKLPMLANNKIDIDALHKSQYLGTDVEKQCNCSFYLKADKQTVIAIPKGTKNQENIE